jgi:hypothetical protein
MKPYLDSRVQTSSMWFSYLYLMNILIMLLFSK